MTKDSTKSVFVNRLNQKTLAFTIKGTNNLIFHKWSEKAIKMIEDKQQKKAAKAREIRNPDAEYQESFYYDKDKNIAFPALNLKQAFIQSARNVEGLTMTLLRGAIFVVGDEKGLIPVTYKEKKMRTDMVRVGMGTADVRYRGELVDWSMPLTVKYNADVISDEQIINLFQIAGFSQGIGEWRPARNGDYGTFELVMEKSEK